jgi:hypothetical protein
MSSSRKISTTIEEIHIDHHSHPIAERISIANYLLYLGSVDSKAFIGRWAAHVSQTFEELIAKPACFEVGFFVL